MTRLIISVEGDTEESFVNRVLTPHLCAHGYTMVEARTMGRARQRSHRGGVIRWQSARRDIIDLLREDSGCVVSTMVDYYGMLRDWPRRSDAALSDATPSQTAKAIEQAMLEDIAPEMGNNFDLNRFIPYVMMHEFEAMLFSDGEGFGRGIEHPDLIQSFQAIRNEFASPEEIDDSPYTAPSKRIQKLLPAYQKALMGTLAALEIGLDAIRDDCPHFRGWLERLESLP